MIVCPDGWITILVAAKVFPHRIDAIVLTWPMRVSFCIATLASLQCFGGLIPIVAIYA